jgi:hypothetical protein
LASHFVTNMGFQRVFNPLVGRRAEPYISWTSKAKRSFALHRRKAITKAALRLCPHLPQAVPLPPLPFIKKSKGKARSGQIRCSPARGIASALPRNDTGVVVEIPKRVLLSLVGRRATPYISWSRGAPTGELASHFVTNLPFIKKSKGKARSGQIRRSPARGIASALPRNDTELGHGWG